MLGTKRLALRRSGMWKTGSAIPKIRVDRRLSGRAVLMWCGVALLIALGPPVQAQRLTLPPEEQDAVNHAIDRGVDYLKASQFKTGTWAQLKAPHEVGYSALPGLTLLECGVPPSDPIIQRTARFVRSKAASLNTTYELSLIILFLDRLGEPRDKKLIQTLALRLIAGQSATGGWGYKCPVLTPAIHAELLAALRHLNPPLEGGLGGGRDPVNMPGIAGRPDNMPAAATNPDRDRGDLPSLAEASSEGPTTKPGDSSRGTLPDGGSGSSLQTPDSTRNGSDLFRDWLGFTKPPPVPPPPPEKKGAQQAPDGKPDARPDKPNAKDAGLDDKNNDKDGRPAAPRKAYVIPERLRLLPVIQDPELHVLKDPQDKRHELIVSTTDNSNTQFAILALWAAQRHGVPMERSLKLMVRRFLTSQNADGTWSYDYVFRGGQGGTPPMTCVGLIGMAVGHGLANREAGAPPVRDPRILNGLVALSRFIGQPAERIGGLPMQNLYFLWSVERVAVLYKLSKIGDKDWYRWGAQILVANQDSKGNWANGQYHGSSPPLDTCLALLFLKRANLVGDLTSRLPFNAADLNSGVLEKLAPPPSAPTPKTPESIQKTTAKTEPAKSAEPDPTLSKPTGAFTGIPAAPSADSDVASTGGGRGKWVALGIVLFLLVAGGGLLLVLLLVNRRTDENEEEEVPRKKRKAVKGKRKGKTMAAGSDAGV